MTGSGLTFQRSLFAALVLGLAILALGVAAHAADSAPATRAARLTYLQGTVTVNEAGGNASVPAQLNLPLLSGVQILTAEDGQAEVEFEDGSVVRLTPNSALSLDNLAVDPSGVFTTELSLLHGLAYAELRATPEYRYWLNAGGDAISPVENTTVRINFDRPPTIFSVLDGTAHIERQNGSANFEADVRAGETFSIDPNQSNYTLTQGISPDSWDQWNEDLDQSAAAQAADTTEVRNNYAGAQGYGWSDLDANGTWYDVPGEGPVWQPELAVDDASFDPYGYGSWVSYPVVGYVWASSYAWGWTPYRCGNWSYFSGFGWGWAPGAGCGAMGWAFIGSGRPVNIARFPTGYRPIRVPAPGHGPERPLIQVHTAAAFVRPGRTAGPVQYSQRQIAGVTARPIPPVHKDVNPGGPVAGSSLRRDYPVDSKTRMPVLGLAGTRPAAVSTAPGTQPASRPIRGPNPATPTARPAPATSYSEPSRQYNEPARPAAPAAGVRPAPQMQRPGQEDLPAQRTPPSPTPSPAHPTYSPPPSQPSQPTQPRYTPQPSQPPAQTPVHPTYSPPPPSQPSQPPQPRYTPPPAQPPAPSPAHPTYSPPPPQPSQPSQPRYTPPPSPPPAPPASHPSNTPSAPSAPAHYSPR